MSALGDKENLKIKPEFDVARIRLDFPVLSREVHGKKLIYLDNGASAQKPRAVINTMSELMSNDYANVHRGVHYLSQLTTERYENVRKIVADFIKAPTPEQIVFTRGGTEAINLVANSYAKVFLHEGDEVVISEMEHHANIVPWQMLRDSTGVRLKVVPIDEDGNFIFEAYENLLSSRTKLVAVTHVSNVLGTLLPVREIVNKAHTVGAKVLVDGCQSVAHMPIDVTDLDADFYVFSGHKLYGPTGIGILFAKAELLEKMPPWQGGGDMIRSVSFDTTTYADPPHRFEAGTPAIVEAIGLGAAIKYLSEIGMEKISAYESKLVKSAHTRLKNIPGLEIYGNTKDKAGIVSFTLKDIHPHDIGTFVDQAGIAIRVGHHCAEPLMHRFGVAAMGRASIGLYNLESEIETFGNALRMTQEFFS